MIALSPRLEILPGLYVSKLRNFIPDLRHTVSHADLVVEPDHPCIEYSSVILDRGMRCLHAELPCVENTVVETRT